MTGPTQARHRPDEPESGDLALFDVDAPPVEPVEKVSADRRRTIRQRQSIERRVHPLSGSLRWNLPLHPDVQIDRDGGGPRCGTCVFRVLAHHHNRAYAKCAADARTVTRRRVDGTPYEATQYPRITHGAGSDVRAHWPACPDYELGDTGKSPDAARWNPTREEPSHAR